MPQSGNTVTVDFQPALAPGALDKIKAQLKDALSPVFDPLLRATQGGGVGQSIKTGIGVGAGISIFSGLESSLSKFVEAANPAMLELLSQATRDVAGVLGQTLTPVFQALVPLVRLFGDVLRTILPDQDQMQRLMAAIVPLFDSLRTVLTPIATAAKSVVDVFVSALVPAANALARVLSYITSLFSNLGSVLGAYAGYKLGGFGNLSGVASGAKGVASSIGQFLSMSPAAVIGSPSAYQARLGAIAANTTGAYAGPSTVGLGRLVQRGAAAPVAQIATRGAVAGAAGRGLAAGAGSLIGGALGSLAGPLGTLIGGAVVGYGIEKLFDLFSSKKKSELDSSVGAAATGAQNVGVEDLGRRLVTSAYGLGTSMPQNVADIATNVRVLTGNRQLPDGARPPGLPGAR